MDKKVFTMAILTIISAFILILVIVYATNTAKINRLFGWGTEKEPAAEEVLQEEATEVSAPAVGQIGDNLDGFILDEEFFDETEKIPSVVVIKRSPSSAGASDDASAVTSALVGDDGITGRDGTSSDTDQNRGSGMAVVGELTNPNPELPAGYQDDATGASGYLTSVPETPPGGFGQYIPADQTITGTPVGN